MPDKQLYHLTIGYQNGQSVQALTYMDRKAVREALDSQPDNFNLVHLSCVGSDGGPIDVDVATTGIQLMMHQRFTQPTAQQRGRPDIVIPRVIQ